MRILASVYPQVWATNDRESNRVQLRLLLVHRLRLACIHPLHTRCYSVYTTIVIIKVLVASDWLIQTFVIVRSFKVNISPLAVSIDSEQGDISLRWMSCKSSLGLTLPWYL